MNLCGLLRRQISVAATKIFTKILQYTRSDLSLRRVASPCCCKLSPSEYRTLQLKYTVSMPEKISICLNRGREESVGNDDVSIVCASKLEMVRMTLRQKIPKGGLGHRVLRSFVWINELLILSLILRNLYTCRLARLISPVGSLWIYCKRFLRFLSDADRLCCSPSFAVLKINNRKPYPRWRTARRPKGDRGTKCQSCEPSVSWFVVYRMCNDETVTRSK